jgi:aspartyl-tRNA(Asn)/glutamyl-tRNA(Gln) amidotransferase subunit B
MPEPDLPPINLSRQFINNESAKLSMMPSDYREKFGQTISTDILEILLDYPELMETMNGIDEKHITMIANLFTSVLLAEEKSVEYLNDLPDTKKLNDLAEMNEKKELSSTATKEVFLRLFDPQMKGRDTKTIAKELGLIQENDLGALEAIVDAVLKKPETKKAQDDFRNGEEKVIGFLVGQVMKESKGKANPSAVQQILRDKLK